jgi:hypothetical protein
MKRAFFLVLCLGLVAACLGTTGYDLVSFYVAASGPAGAVAGHPYAFDTAYQGRSYHVVLTQAVLHVGALYLDQSVPTSGGGSEPCTLPGTYVGEVRGGRDIDMLNGSLQGFPVAGDGSTIPAAVGQVWLTGGDVNADQDPTVILTLAGTATASDGTSYPFLPPNGGVSFTINPSGGAAPNALPGENPICVQRIVTPIVTNLILSQSGTLVLRLDPSQLMSNVDFSTFKKFSDDPTAYGCTDTEADSLQGCINVYANLRAAGPVYRFEWLPAK